MNMEVTLKVLWVLKSHTLQLSTHSYTERDISCGITLLKPILHPHTPVFFSSGDLLAWFKHTFCFFFPSKLLFSLML